MDWEHGHPDHWREQASKPQQSTNGTWDKGGPVPPAEHVYVNGSCVYCGHSPKADFPFSDLK